MSKPKVYNKRGGYPSDAVYCGRGSPYGNPFIIGEHGDRDKVIEKFRTEVLPNLDVEPLRGKNLLCFCAPKKCHCDYILRKANSKRITKFRGKHAFLSNFYPCKIPVGNIVFPSVEHAYQALKSDDLKVRARIAKMKTPQEAKKAGRALKIDNSWRSVYGTQYMRLLLAIKFSHPKLSKKLLATKNRALIEGNSRGDRFWGQSPLGKGENTLGCLLEFIREIIRVRGRLKNNIEGIKS